MTTNRLRAFLRFTLALSAAVFHVAPAGAYCRATTCDRAKGCAVDAHGCVGQGEPVWWNDGTVELWTDSAGSALRGIAPEDVLDAIGAALGAWTEASCPEGGPPGLDVSVAGLVEGGTIGFDQKNLTAFYDTAWPYGVSAVAKTVLRVDLDIGEILDADLAVNSAGHAVASAPGSDEVDLVAVLTHELGHVFGLDHSDVPGATMQPETDGFGTAELRTLEPDDVAGICAIYPPVSDPPPPPVGGGDPPADDASSGGSCAVTTGGRAGRDGSSSLSAALVAIGLAVRRFRFTSDGRALRRRAPRTGPPRAVSSH